MSSACAADKYIYDETLESEVLEKPFTSKEMIPIFDSNNGVYNNQILFSSGTMNSTGKWVDFQNSYIEIPFVIALKSDQNVAAANLNPYMMGLKDSSIQLIDSLILQYNGTSVVQNSIFTNVMQHFKILASWTQEDLIKWGSTTITAPDTTNSFYFSNGAASPFGDGLCNNVIGPVTPAANAAGYYNTSYNSNPGFQKRLQFNGPNPNTTMSGLRTETAGSSNAIGKNFFSNNGAGGAAQVYYVQLLLTIRCKDMSDFFNKIPVMKAGRIDLTININTAYGTVTYTGAASGTDGTMITASYNQTAGHCCPFMLAGASDTTGGVYVPQPMKALSIGAAHSGILTVGCGINGVSGLSGVSNAGAFSNCRWYVPVYEADPMYEQQLLATNPVKTIYYDDFYTYTSIVAQTGSFQTLVTAGVKNPQYVMLFPFFNNAVGNSGNAVSNSPYQSFFDSAPATTSPVSLTNFQVQCGGKSMFPLIELYSFQQFMDEFSSIFALNGGKSDIVTSGLIERYQWEQAPVYICNLSRRLPQDDGSPKSVQISATVNSKNPTAVGSTATIDVIVFIVYQRKCEFNLLNGLLVSDSI